MVYGDHEVLSSQEYGRVFVDCAFTKLFCNWDDEGTARFVINVTTWLLGIEHKVRLSQSITMKEKNKINFKTAPIPIVKEKDNNILNQIVPIITPPKKKKRSVSPKKNNNNTTNTKKQRRSVSPKKTKRSKKQDDTSSEKEEKEEEEEDINMEENKTPKKMTRGPSKVVGSGDWKRDRHGRMASLN